MSLFNRQGEQLGRQRYGARNVLTCAHCMKKNDAGLSLGYDYGTTSTTARSGGTVSQKSYEPASCPCSCHKTNSVKCAECDHSKGLHDPDCAECGCQKYKPDVFHELDNMACPVCSDDEQGVSAMMDHLTIDHGMTREKAERALGG